MNSYINWFFFLIIIFKYIFVNYSNHHIYLNHFLANFSKSSIPKLFLVCKAWRILAYDQVRFLAPSYLPVFLSIYSVIRYPSDWTWYQILYSTESPVLLDLTANSKAVGLSDSFIIFLHGATSSAVNISLPLLLIWSARL